MASFSACAAFPVTFAFLLANYFAFPPYIFSLSFFFVWLLIYILLSCALIFSLKVNSLSISLVAFLWILSLCLSFSSIGPSWLGARLSYWWSHSFQKSFNNWLCLTRQVSLFQGVLGTSPCHLCVCLASQIFFFGFVTAFHTFVSRVLFKTLPFVSCWSVLFYVILLFAWNLVWNLYLFFFLSSLCMLLVWISDGSLTTLSMICTICAHLECCKVFSFGLMPFLVVFLALILCVCIPSCSPSPTVNLITVMLKRSSLMHLAFVLRNKPAFTYFFNIVFFLSLCLAISSAGLVWFTSSILFGLALLLF